MLSGQCSKGQGFSGSRLLISHVIRREKKWVPTAIIILWVFVHIKSFLSGKYSSETLYGEGGV